MCNIGRFLVSSLAAVGGGNAVVGGVVIEGACCVGDYVAIPHSSDRDTIQEIQFYGRKIERAEKGLSAGLLVSLEWAERLTLSLEIECGP